MQRERTLSVTIPAGVEDGTRIRLAGEGEAGLRGAPPGDLYIFLSIAPHRVFQRDGADIYLPRADPDDHGGARRRDRGADVDGSRARVTIPPGTQTGQPVPPQGKGMTVLRSTTRGDMYRPGAVETPVNLTRKQQELLREFEKAGQGSSHSPESEASSRGEGALAGAEGLGSRGVLSDQL